MRVDELEKLWNKYLTEWVAGNDWLKRPYFHVMLGQLMHGYYYSAFRKRSWRVHLFGFQSSRSGKGQVMKATHFLFEYFNKELEKNGGKKNYYRSIYMDNAVTPAWLSGGIEERAMNVSGKIKKDRVLIPGALKTYNYIAWGEGENVIKPDNTYGNIGTLLRNALDEPGIVTLTARKDIGEDGSVPTYYTNASICTGSIYNPELATTAIINSGILQRFLITFKTFKGSEMIKLRENIDKLETSYNVMEEKDIRKEFFDEFFNKKYEKEIRFTRKEADIDKYISYREKKEKDYMEGFYGLKFETMQAFLTANRLFDKKIAAMICAYEGEKEITFEDLKKASEITLPTLDFAKDLLFKKFITEGTKDENKRLDMLNQIINDFAAKNRVLITKSDILEQLRKLKNQNKWDLGRNSSAEYINQLIEKRVLSEESGPKNTKYIKKS